MDVTRLIPRKEDKQKKIIINSDSQENPFPPHLPLHIFDNADYDPRTWQEWLGIANEDGVQKPVPGKALLPDEGFCLICCTIINLKVFIQFVS